MSSPQAVYSMWKRLVRQFLSWTPTHQGDLLAGDQLLGSPYNCCDFRDAEDCKVCLADSLLRPCINNSAVKGTGERRWGRSLSSVLYQRGVFAVSSVLSFFASFFCVHSFPIEMVPFRQISAAVCTQDFCRKLLKCIYNC